MKKALIAASLALAATGSQAYTLDFGSGSSPMICSTNAAGSGAMTACSSGSWINQGYGDVAGVFDVTYTAVRAASSLSWWGPDYNNLLNVAYANASHARIEIELVQPGATSVNLTHFDMGAWFRTTRTTNVAIFEIGGTTPLYTFMGPVGNGNSHTDFNVDLTSSVGLWIEWRDEGFNVGMDNIDFTVTTVIPEPQTYALFLAGLGLLGFVARRRRALPAP
jgi:hypothetical protein